MSSEDAQFRSFDPTKELFTAREAATVLALSEPTIDRLIRSGALESVRILRSRRITRRSLERIVREGVA
jgi:excisionase family DNA binding protein